MRKSTSSKKLVLKKETVASLDYRGMNAVQAGERAVTGQKVFSGISNCDCPIQPQETYTCDTDCTCPVGGGNTLADPGPIPKTFITCREN
ncbi:MAG: hypothetical protein GY765_22735 [bacterium]|nr:hypothetical protein [bacterium]